MDRTVKFLLALIALSLISLNLQLAGFELVGEANAQGLDHNDFRMIQSGLLGIESAITNASVMCN